MFRKEDRRLRPTAHDARARLSGSSRFPDGPEAKSWLRFHGLQGGEPRTLFHRQRARAFDFSGVARSLGRPIQDLKISYRPVGIRASINQAYADRARVLPRDVEWQASGAETRSLEVQVVPLTDTSGSVVSAAIAFTDSRYLTSLRGGVAVVDHELKVLVWNEHARHLLTVAWRSATGSRRHHHEGGSRPVIGERSASRRKEQATVRSGAWRRHCDTTAVAGRVCTAATAGGPLGV